MAVDSAKSSADFCVYLGWIDPKIERLLWLLEDEPVKEVVEEIVNDFDIQEILSAREDLFVKAQAKAKASRVDENKDSESRSGVGDTRSSFIVCPWTLINRRIPSLAGTDLCEIYMYLTDLSDSFPTRILKRKPMASARELPKVQSGTLDRILENNESLRTVSDGSKSSDDNSNSTDVIDRSSRNTSGNGSTYVNTPTFRQSSESSFKYIMFSEIDPMNEEKDVDEMTDGFVPDANDPSGCGDNDIVDRTFGGECETGSSNATIEKTRETLYVCNASAIEEIMIQDQPHFIPSTPIVDHLPKSCEPKVSPINNTKGDTEISRINYCSSTGVSSKSDRAAVDSSPKPPPEGHISERQETQDIDQWDTEGTRHVSEVAPRHPVSKSHERDTATPEAVDSSLDDISGSSQESFLRELRDIHKKLTAPDGTANYKVSASNKTVYVTDMAAQTGPKGSVSKPVMKPEFDSFADSTERALTDHERRTTSIEIWQGRTERKFEKDNAVLFDHLCDLLKAQQQLSGEIVSLRETVKTLSMREVCACGGVRAAPNNEHEDVCERGRPVEGIENNYDSRGPSNNISMGVQQNNKGKKGNSSTYTSFMKAASKAIPPIPTARVSDESVPQKVATHRVNVVRSDPGGRVNDRAENGELQQRSSTPIPSKAKTNVSWADVDDDDDNVVDDFIASVVLQEDIGGACAASGTAAMSQRAAVKPAPGYEKAASNIIPRNSAAHGGAKPVDVVSIEKSIVPPVRNSATSGNHRTVIRENGVNVDSGNTVTGKGNGGARPKVPIVREGNSHLKNVINKNEPAQNGKSVVRENEGDDGKNLFNVLKSIDDDGNIANESYADVAGKHCEEEEWDTQVNKRKRMNSGPKTRQTISGPNVKPNKEIFVRDLATSGFKNSDELEEAVKFYCKERGVNVVFARVMASTVSKNVVNCRIAVKQDDASAVLNQDFWPEAGSVRNWYQKNRTRKPSFVFGNSDEGTP